MILLCVVIVSILCLLQCDFISTDLPLPAVTTDQSHAAAGCW